MKIYILLDTYLNMEQHCDFIDVFDDADELLKYIEKNQSDGHKFEIHTKEVKEQPSVLPTSPQPLDPLKPGDTYPLGITWGYSCVKGGICIDPQHDCINCPRPYEDGETFATYGIKSKDLKTEYL